MYYGILLEIILDNSGIKLKNYNYSLPLIIDPVTLLWSTYLGGSANQDFAYDIAVDGSENVYVTGETSSNNFPVSVGTYDNSYNNNTDVFVTKLNPTATSIIFSTYIGGGAQDKAYGIDIDNSQNIYVVGTVSGGGFPYTPGAMITTWKGSFDGFALKLNNAGNNLLYATGVAGGTHENCTDVIVDYSTGNVFITGYTRSSDFPHSTTGVYQTSKNGDDDAYIIELNATGTALVRGTFFGGNGSDFGNSLKRDNTGYIYLLGRTNGIISTTSGCYQNTLSGGWDLFICKLSSDLSTLLYSTYLGGSDNEDTYYNSLDIDTTGNVYVTGYTGSTNFPITSGVLQTTKNPSNDAFVSKLQLNGLGSSDLIYSTYLGGDGDDQGRSVVVFDNGSVFVTGYANSNFYATVDAYQPTNPPNQDVFLIWLSADFSTPLYSTYFGGDNAEESYSLKHDANYNVYICGTSYSSNFPTTTGVIQTSYAGIRDAFVAKFSTSFNPLPIELIYFKAEVTDNNYVRLIWETATELNNDYFTVERSKNGFDFEQVLTQKGAGNSNHSIKYTAYDYSPYEGISYYRLKQTDFDGKYKYSQIVAVNFDKLKDVKALIYPNPAEYQITIEGLESELQDINIYNSLWQDITNLTTKTEISRTKVIIDISDLSKGIYFIKTKTIAIKVTKQ
ncbi:MAG: hypothetical protein KatS3mg035_2294 [Bacteroidia bacterium]|nr:MAG: hypothetical protein KatS3mg035_2294 [Bacteroidia bacterium]